MRAASGYDSDALRAVQFGARDANNTNGHPVGIGSALPLFPAAAGGESCERQQAERCRSRLRHGGGHHGDAQAAVIRPGIGEHVLVTGKIGEPGAYSGVRYAVSRSGLVCR